MDFPREPAGHTHGPARALECWRDCLFSLTDARRGRPEPRSVGWTFPVGLTDALRGRPEPKSVGWTFPWLLLLLLLQELWR